MLLSICSCKEQNVCFNWLAGEGIYCLSPLPAGRLAVMNALGQLETGHSFVFGTLCLLMSFCLARFLHGSVSRTAVVPG